MQIRWLMRLFLLLLLSFGTVACLTEIDFTGMPCEKDGDCGSYDDFYCHTSVKACCFVKSQECCSRKDERCEPSEKR